MRPRERRVPRARGDRGRRCREKRLRAGTPFVPPTNPEPRGFGRSEMRLRETNMVTWNRGESYRNQSEAHARRVFRVFLGSSKPSFRPDSLFPCAEQLSRTSRSASASSAREHTPPPASVSPRRAARIQPERAERASSRAPNSTRLPPPRSLALVLEVWHTRAATARRARRSRPAPSSGTGGTLSAARSTAGAPRSCTRDSIRPSACASRSRCVAARARGAADAPRSGEPRL